MIGKYEMVSVVKGVLGLVSLRLQEWLHQTPFRTSEVSVHKSVNLWLRAWPEADMHHYQRENESYIF